MLKNKEKAELIFDIHGRKGDPLCNDIVKLLDILISETRVFNDTAPPEESCKNQGEIRAYLKIKDYIERGLPKTTQDYIKTIDNTEI